MDGLKLGWMIGISLCFGVAVVPVRADEHQHHKHGAHNHRHLSEKDIAMPKDYSSAVARIKKCRVAIGEEIAAGHLDEVHAPLDEVTIILNKLMPLARNSGIPKAQWQEINVAAKDLKKRFDGLHSAIERKQRFDFKAAVPPIDQAIRRLELVAQVPNEVLTR